MLEVNSNLGGEKSGHIIPIDYASTGDGLVSALQVLVYLKKENLLASSIRNLYVSYPQIFKNTTKQIDTSSNEIISLIKHIEDKILKKNGRILIRKSGTEDMTRVMIESNNQDDIDETLIKLAGVL